MVIHMFCVGDTTTLAGSARVFGYAKTIPSLRLPPGHPDLETLRWRYFWRKSNQNVGVAIRPHPNAAQCVETLVCYKSVKITNLSHCVPSHCNFSSIYASISPPVSLWLTLALCLLSADTAIITRGKVFPRTPFY